MLNKALSLLVFSMIILDCNSNKTIGYNKKVAKVFYQENLDNYLFDTSFLKELEKRSEDELREKGMQIIDKKHFSSWEDCQFNTNDYQYFLIRPGDYRSWGTLSLEQSGTKAKKRVICYYNPTQAASFIEEHPAQRAKSSRELIIESINLSSASHWIIHGLTFRGHSQVSSSGVIGGESNRINANSNHNVIDKCLFEEVAKKGTLRINWSNYNTIQNCVIRNAIPNPKADNIGIGVKGGNLNAIGNRIINNEIYDCTDGVQLVYNKKTVRNGYTPGTIVANNDIYLTEKMYRNTPNGQFACAENAIDVKVGGRYDSPEEYVHIVNNRIWGFRATDTSCGGSGSSGKAIGTHMKANYIYIKNNTIFDCNDGIHLAAILDTTTAKMKIYADNNTIKDIRARTDSRKKSCAFRVNISTNLTNNTIENVDYAIVAGSKNVDTILLENNIVLNAKVKVRASKKTRIQEVSNLWIEQSEQAPKNKTDFYIGKWTGRTQK